MIKNIGDILDSAIGITISIVLICGATLAVAFTVKTLLGMF